MFFSCRRHQEDAEAALHDAERVEAGDTSTSATAGSNVAAAVEALARAKEKAAQSHERVGDLKARLAVRVLIPVWREG